MHKGEKKSRGNWTPSDDDHDDANDGDADYGSLVSPTAAHNEGVDGAIAAVLGVEAGVQAAAAIDVEVAVRNDMAAAGVEAAAEAALAAADKNDDAAEDGPCGACARLLGDLKRHVESDHSGGPISVQKAAIRAWFECHYMSGRGAAVGENPVAVARKTLLGEINAFLEGMGWPTWKTQSVLYKDWFLRDVMALTDDDIRKGRNWSLHYRDGFAPGGHMGNARTQQQRMYEVTVYLRKYMGVE